MNIEKQDVIPSVKSAHNVVIENRRSLTATAVTAIVSYDEYSAVLDTQQGTLTVGGENIHVSELSVQTGEVKINGSIEYVQYSVKKEKAMSIFKRLGR